MTAGKGVDAVFQSTLSQGERRKISATQKQSEAFQSTLSQGERLEQQSKCLMKIIISIHALARRATAMPSWA